MNFKTKIQFLIILTALVVGGAGLMLAGMGLAVGLPYAIFGVVIAVMAWNGWSAVARPPAQAKELSSIADELLNSARAEKTGRKP